MPRSTFLTAAAAAILLFSSAPPAAARVIGRGAEISVGRETASIIERYFTVDSDPVAVARVRQIGRRLAASARNAEFPFEFHVVESASVNAFALPGGFIYVFRGLLQLVPNDDALAFVLAHEISHVTGSHSIRQFEKNVLLSAGITAVLAGTGGGFGAAADVVQVLASLSFTRSDERDADATGIELMTRAGYNPRAAVEAMELVKRAGGDGGGIPALLRSHPAPDSRIRKLAAMSETLLAARAAGRKAVAPPPAPAAAARKLPGLEALEVAPCPWVPLVPGARWVYRVRGEGAESAMTVRVLEEVAAEPAGVYRVEYELERGIRGLRLVAPAGDRCVSRGEAPDAPKEWRVDAVFAEGERASRPDGSVRFAGVEKVRVPAGEFEAARVERLGPGGQVEATLWYARGVGLVRKDAAGGTSQELKSYLIPAR